MIGRPLPPVSQSGSNRYAANAQTTVTAAYGLKNQQKATNTFKKETHFPNRNLSWGHPWGLSLNHGQPTRAESVHKAPERIFLPRYREFSGQYGVHWPAAAPEH